MPLLHNITLLITLGILYGLVIRSWRKGTFYYSISTGFLFSIVAVVGMMNAVVLAPGLIFDGRSIIISIASFLGGPVTAIITAITTGAYRIWLGGQGMVMGLSVISESALIGLVFFYLDKKYSWVKSNLGMLMFGVLVHTVMLLMMYLLPSGLQAQAFSQVAVPVIIIYPLATVVLCLFFIAQEERVVSETLLKESEERYRSLYQNAPAMLHSISRQGKLVSVSSLWLKTLGYKQEDVLGRNSTDFLTEESRRYSTDKMLPELFRSGYVSEVPYQFVKRNGEIIDISLSAVAEKDENGEVTRSMAVLIDVTDKKRAEEALGESESRYYRLAENARDIIYRMSLPSGHYEYVSPASENIFGYTPDEFYNTPQLNKKIIHPDWLDYFAENWKKLLEGNIPAFFEYQIIDKTGNEKWIYQSNVLIFGDDNKPVALEGIVTDITERKQAEQVLCDREKQLRTIIEASNDAIVAINHKALITLFNPAAEEMFGQAAEEMIGKALDNLMPEQYRLEHRASLEDYYRRGKPNGAIGRTLELLALRNNSTVFPIELSLSVGERSGQKLVFATIRDITERKQAEEELQRSKALLRKVLDSVPNYICAKDLNGRFLMVNKALAAFYGTTVDEMTGVLHADICEDEEELKAMLAADREAIESGRPNIISEEPMKKPDGSITYLETIKIPFAIFGDPAVLIMSRDITERKELEAERNKAAKLESIGLLAGGIAHDFNNVLTAILGNISLANLLAEKDLEKAREILTEAEKATLSAKDLTRQLLTFAIGGEPVRKTIRLPSMIAETSHFSLRGSNVKCDLQLEDALWPVDVDEGQVKQAINNIVINACQAMPKGGVISIQADNVTVSSGDSLPLAGGKYVKITIRDKGIGIAEEYLTQIFDPYFTTKSKGSGLGLSTTYSIIKRHGGHTSVESELKAGTTFYIYLPASTKKVEEKEAENKATPTAMAKILLMDDEQALCDAVSKILEYVGHEVEIVTDGAEAVKRYKKAQNSSRPFDAVILDLTVQGGMGGKETIKKLLEIDPEVKAIVSSGYSNDPVLANFRDYGFSGVVSKPYRIDELQKVLQDVLGV